MKKIIMISIFFLVLFLLAFSINIYADSLDTIDINTSVQTVHPGENVVVNVNFGENLGAYTVDIAYDNNLLEYVSAEGGTPNDTGTKVRVYFYDSTGGSNPRSTMSVTFRAKENIITSNPTDLSITAEGMANSDASVTYDDILVPIVKNIVVEPKYIDYNIDLNYTGDVIENEEKAMELVISSAMGKNYEHTRIIAEAVTPSNQTVKLLATDEQLLEHDIIQSGWGDASGDPLGGKDVLKKLNIRGVFSGVGEYEITFKIIDRDSSDTVIATKAFKINVNEKTTTPDNNTTVPPETGDTTTSGENDNTDKTEEPTTLPKTGNMMYYILIPSIAVLLVVYVLFEKRFR